MSTKAAARVRGDLRVLLRHVKALPSTSSCGLGTFIVGKFRDGMHAGNRDAVKALRWQAHDAAQMVKATAERRELIDIYAGEKMTQAERMNLSAYRVGLRMPESYQDEDEVLVGKDSKDSERQKQ
eukprot:TRINITY_DN13421_c0_g1_i1.p1 TRINITY_DN13421_c0_g1~~TRINITY_DN13421_c0_g1_i1.p1  ORF type:complete len:125 (-),score=20.50 TRINITY_DN13421_c0_g1_i1:14-388(-)